jgi:outer membrane protein W
MKKIAWALFFLVVFSSTVYAADPPKFGVGVRVGHNFYRGGNMDITDSGLGYAGKYDYSNNSTWMYGINGTFKFNEYFSLELAIDRTTGSKHEVKVGGMSLKTGDTTQTPITLTARLHYPVGMFSPYIGLGGGYYFNSYDKDNTFWNPATSTKVDDAWGFHVNAGSEFFLTQERNLALNLDFKYVWTKTDLKGTLGPTWVSGSINLDSFIVGMGIKYYF